MKNKIKVCVERANAASFHIDVLVLKYAQELYGLDEVVVDLFEQNGTDIRSRLPNEGSTYLTKASYPIFAKRILFVGVKELKDFRYKEIREFASDALGALVQLTPEAKSIGITLHGAGYGLDELEAFESEVAGLMDAIAWQKYPPQLETIYFLEDKPARAKRLKYMLSKLIPGGSIGIEQDSENLSKTSERLRSAGYSTESKPHIFVAMPFDETMDDVYYYGIKGAVNSAGFVCERADLSSFTGDVLNWIHKRIRTANFVVADLTNANPNVYLEVGYAWGCGVPTILIARDPIDLKFDVSRQRCLVYKRIKDLEKLLKEELENLKKKDL